MTINEKSLVVAKSAITKLFLLNPIGKNYSTLYFYISIYLHIYISVYLYLWIYIFIIKTPVHHCSGGKLDV